MHPCVTNRKIKRLREARSYAAKIRWQRDRERRNRLDTLDPIQVGGKVVRRIVVIENESKVKERCFYEFDRGSDYERKLKELGL